MKTTTLIMLVLKAALATALLFLSTTILFGQEKQKVEKTEKYGNKVAEKMNKEFCGNNWSNGDKVSVRDLREMTIPATGSLAVDGRQNGGIKVKGSERSDVLVRACVQAWGTSEEAAQALMSSVKISTGSLITADAASDRGWSVSYEILVPRSTNLDLKAQNGGIGISSVEGTLQFETHNGGVSLWDVAGDVKGRTTNGAFTWHLAVTAGEETDSTSPLQMAEFIFRSRTPMRLTSRLARRMADSIATFRRSTLRRKTSKVSRVTIVRHV